MRHLVCLTILLGGLKVDGKGENRLAGDSHQVGAFMLFFLAPSVELPAVGVITDWSDDLNELFNQFRGKTGTANIELLLKKIMEGFHVGGNSCGIGFGSNGFQILFQTVDLIVSLFAKRLIFFPPQFTIGAHCSIVHLAILDFFNLALNRCCGYQRSGFSAFAAFNHLAGKEDSLVLIAPDLFKNLLYHYTAFLWYNGSIKTEEARRMSETFEYGVSNYNEKALVETLNDLVQHVENEVVEFKLASNNFDLHKLGQYFSAISNEANLRNKKYGWLIFGVDDATHEFRGTNYKNNPVSMEKLKLDIAKETTGAISFMDIFVVHPFSSEGRPVRIVMFQIPAAVTAIPTGWKNRFYGREGESLVDLSQEKIDRIRGERRTDWTREIVDGASLSHLDTKAISIARANYRERLSNAANSNAVEELDKMDDYQFLSKIKLIRNGKITKAAFILLGNSDYSDFFEVPPQIMWRLYDHKGNTIDHEIFDIPFLCAIDSVYKKIRNLTYRYMPNQLSLFPTETQQYDSWLLRELLNNCIAHQDYTADRRIYVDEFEDRIVISNAGQFLPGNIKPVLEPAYAPPYYRNPLLAQAMVNFKMIDTASMGIRRVYSIQKEKLFPMPDYDLSRYQQVRVTVYGKILNDNYTKILFENPDMDLDTVYLLDRVQKGESISRLEAATLRKLGLVEGKIPKLFVSATVAEALDQKAQYIKNKGFDDQYYKQLIVDYLNKWGKGRKNDFEKLLFDKLPDSLTAEQKNTKIRNLLSSLRIHGVIETDSENHQRSNWVLTKNRV